MGIVIDRRENVARFSEPEFEVRDMPRQRVRTVQHRCRSLGSRRFVSGSPTTIVECRNPCLTLARRGPTTTPEPFSLRGGEPSNRWARSHARTEWSRTASTCYRAALFMVELTV